MEKFVGRDIGRYLILDSIGEGGMAAVYRAYDERLDRQVAIKVIRLSGSNDSLSEEALKRFEREARALAKLSHPNIVKIYDYGEYSGFPYLVMEYLVGGTLRSRMGQPTAYSEAARLILPIARALDYAHRQGIIHRDVKPSNILLSESGEPMLSDFGIAKLINNEDSMTLTGEGMSVGTPEYTAPEQSVGDVLDHRADIYSLGVVFFELITGCKPFTAETPVAVMVKHVIEPFPPAKLYVPDIPIEVEAILTKALAKKPVDRFSNMADFARALEPLLVLTAELREAEEKERTQASVLAANQTQQISSQTVKEGVNGLDAKVDEYLARGPAQKEQVVQQPTPLPKSNISRKWLPIGVVVLLVLLLMAGLLAVGLWLSRPRVTALQPTAQITLEMLSSAPSAQLQDVEIDATQSIATNTPRLPTTPTISSARIEAMTLLAEKTVTEEQTPLVQKISAQEISSLLFGPINGSLVHQSAAEGCVSGAICSPLLQAASINVRDFVAQATFYNPYATDLGVWDVGFFFRASAPNDGYHLSIRSDSSWELREQTALDDYVISRGKIRSSALNNTTGKTNRIKLIVFQQQGFFIINDTYIEKLDLSLRDIEGDVYVESGYNKDSQKTGQNTRFEGFMVWSIPTSQQKQEQKITYTEGEMTRLSSEGKMDNFVARMVFTNPYPSNVAPWEIGFAFRSVDKNDEYRLSVSSTTDWELSQQKPQFTQPNVVLKGRIGGFLQVGDEKQNELLLIVIADKGFFYINGEFIRSLDLSNHIRAGDLVAALGIHKRSGLEGRTTQINEFDVWELPQQKGEQQAMSLATQSVEQLLQLQTPTATSAPLQVELIPPRTVDVPIDGELLHTTNGDVLTVDISTPLRDFTAEATFYNPYATPLGIWDIGFYFRAAGDNRYWLIVRADSTWQLIEQSEGERKVIDSNVKQRNKIISLDNTTGKPNKLHLIVLNQRGFLFVNDVYAASFELTKWQEKGTLGLVVGYFPASQKDSYSTRYNDYSVWEIGQPGVGPIQGEFVHDNEEKAKERAAEVKVRNFIASASFNNPYPSTRGYWDAGFAFRSTSQEDQFQLLFTSGPNGSYWRFGNRQPHLNSTSWLSDERLSGIVKIDYPSENSLYLFAFRDKGWFFINNMLVASLDLSTRQTPGDVAVGNGFIINTEVMGEVTRYKDFSVWELPR